MVMGQKEFSPTTISATEVIKILRGEREGRRKPKQLALGQREHKRILDSLIEQVTPRLPGFEGRKTMMKVEAGIIMSKGKLLEVGINPGLRLRVAPDAVIEEKNMFTCLEIKRSYYELHLLQLMFGVMGMNEVFVNGNGGMVQGVLYLYERGDQTQTLFGGGRDHWEQAGEIIQLANEMKELQRSGGGDWYRNNEFEEAMGVTESNEMEEARTLRLEIDELWNKVREGLLQSIDLPPETRRERQ